jgi:peptidase E
MAREPTLVALGGGGFTDPAAAALDRYVLELTRASRPRVCLLPTASGDASAYIAAFYRAFGTRARCSHLGLFQREPSGLRELVLEQDLLYIGGGNTANLLALWRLHGVDALVREAWERGIVLAGVSAGACALFAAGVSASFGTLAPLHDGLGLVDGGFAPHWHERGRILSEMVQGGLGRGHGAGDDVALRFAGRECHEAVATAPGADAFVLHDGTAPESLPLRVLV